VEEFFVAGIKTNVELFRHILLDEDYRAGRIDTGFLDRLRAPEEPVEDKRIAKVAAVGAAVFAMLDSKVKSTEPSAAGHAAGTDNGVSCNWKRAGRVEGLM
jgi:acetyl-CoA carboxylase biotin carboxylase subunit